jgi:hypothetical protein
MFPMMAPDESPKLGTAERIYFIALARWHHVHRREPDAAHGFSRGDKKLSSRVGIKHNPARSSLMNALAKGPGSLLPCSFNVPAESVDPIKVVATG